MIETKNLTKKFDSFTAVDSLDLRIETGEFSVCWDQRCRKDHHDQSAFHSAPAHRGRNPH